MLKGKTTSGFEYEVSDAQLDNMELVDALAELTDNNALAVSKVTTQLLGKEQKKRLYDHVRKDGIVSAQKVSDEILQILQSKPESKN